MQFTLSDIAAACGGRIVVDPDDPARSAPGRVIDGASIDSRSIVAGQLFVPLVAERDGHEFIGDAVAAGAAAYLTSRPHDPRHLPAVPVVVADTASALTELGKAARARLPERVVGVTGSVGKTSVKDLTAAAFATTFATTASLKSFNNELGVPLTLINGVQGSEAAVVEMGARGEGHIAALCSVARPTIGVVTRVAPAHLELFGSVEAVARAKGELVEALPAAPDGVAVLNVDDPRVLAMAARTSARVLTFGSDADIRADHVALDERARARFQAVTPWGRVDVRLAVSGAHMVSNALAALGAALVGGVGLEAAAAGLGEARLSPWRMEITTAPNGVLVLNDAYNASPVAVRAAFDTLLSLGERGRGRRLAVLGQMAELGIDGGAAHAELASEGQQRGIEVFSVGTELYRVAAERCWSDIDAAEAGLASLALGPGDVVLVKASRVVGLERLAERLLVPSGAP